MGLYSKPPPSDTPSKEGSVARGAHTEALRNALPVPETHVGKVQKPKGVSKLQKRLVFAASLAVTLGACLIPVITPKNRSVEESPPNPAADDSLFGTLATVLKPFAKSLEFALGVDFSSERDSSWVDKHYSLASLIGQSLFSPTFRKNIRNLHDEEVLKQANPELVSKSQSYVSPFRLSQRVASGETDFGKAEGLLLLTGGGIFLASQTAFSGLASLYNRLNNSDLQPSR